MLFYEESIVYPHPHSKARVPPVVASGDAQSGEHTCGVGWIV